MEIANSNCSTALGRANVQPSQPSKHHPHREGGKKRAKQGVVVGKVADKTKFKKLSVHFV